ncbi:MAG: indolepyruvate ferredoxin oxidoreductase subunit alpha [Alphaproteobacteria bacterium]|jgi:indolepyruvate ferredoxin oxidoreductase alpha subunit|nr:indolepyruvate ferredoxin oxidoreductase subunit alpha [Alphaproteobacteria bacterium]
MERSFKKEIEALKLGDGDIFEGEGILAVTKALLQSGVAYVGGYQGSPVSNLLDVMVQAKDYMKELGVHVEACANESSAAAMLGASINYPVRGAVTWKSIVGTNVASDALSHLASVGVLGGSLIIIGEDYGEGSSIIQERTHGVALKSTIWLMDPRPNLEVIVRTVHKAFELSEYSHTPVMMQLRIRTCHLQGKFIAKNNIKPQISSTNKVGEVAPHNYDLIAHPPSTYAQEKLKYGQRAKLAKTFISNNSLNEVFQGEIEEIGLIVQGGLYNNLIAALKEMNMSDSLGNTKISIYVLNIVHPLIPDEVISYAKKFKALLVIEEGQPQYIEQELGLLFHKEKIEVSLAGKDVLPMAGEYTSEVIHKGVFNFIKKYIPDFSNFSNLDYNTEIDQLREKVSSSLGEVVPPRPPGFCTGCPERPFFSALKMIEKDTGKIHISTDIGCHSFATFPPFSFGQSILGYGMSLAASAGVQSFSSKRPIAIMGDGGFWHNGLLSGVASRLLNNSDGILVILQNGYTSATGTQDLISTPESENRKIAASSSSTSTDKTIEKALEGLGVKWLKTVHTYEVGAVKKVLNEAIESSFNGLKVIIAEGECQLERQRRLKPIKNNAIKMKKRFVRVKYGVDEDTCTGDHSCIRLSGCPTLTVKPSSDPLKLDPVAHVTDGCVGCGLCGENAIEATLCPSFYKAKIINNPNIRERSMAWVRNKVIGLLT